MRTASLIMLSGLFVQLAHADEIRHATFPRRMINHGGGKRLHQRLGRICPGAAPLC
jgi:hypothetical protein